MGSDTGRDTDGSGLDEYWRRRAIALAGVLGAVGLLAWACAGGGEEGGPPRNAADVAGAGSSVPPAPSAMPTVTVTATAKVTATPTSAKRKEKDGDACAPGDVVIAMESARDTYPAGDRPRFRLTAVNTGGRACTFDVGSRALDLRITSGADRVWSSAQCGRGGGASVRTLRRGVPYAETVTWDRRRGSDGCEGARKPARPGTYVAEVRATGAKVDRQVFRLR